MDDGMSEQSYSTQMVKPYNSVETLVKGLPTVTESLRPPTKLEALLLAEDKRFWTTYCTVTSPCSVAPENMNTMPKEIEVALLSGCTIAS
jgi:hypothetical protein